MGRPTIDSWTMTATDGYTALLSHGPAEGERMPAFDSFKASARLVCSIDNPEFHLAVKRALVMADPRSNVLRIIGNAGQVTLTSEDSSLGSFEETIPVNGVDQFHFAINGDFLESACGSWPLSVWFADDSTAVMFESEDASFRFVVMPIKHEWEGVDLSAREIPAEEISSQPAVSMSAAITKTIQRMNRTVKVKPAGNAWVSEVQF
jgi:DNA polymerase III sliding clamp (beta) subunit (PCNA family)